MQSTQSVAMRALRGPNRWAPCPVLEVTFPIDAPPPASFASDVVALQVSCGAKVSFHATEGTQAAIECEAPELARLCVDAILHPPGDIDNIREFADRILLGPSTRALFGAARKRGIPVCRINHGSMLQLGHGIRQRRLCGALTDRTGSIGVDLSCDKPLVKRLLQSVGVPTPEGRLVADADDACRVAAQLNSPVVVKPESGNHGRSVFIGLTQPAEIAAAFRTASEEDDGTQVLVERCISGAEHRALVVNGRVVAATRGDALYVTGDGLRSLNDLMEELNQDPRRGLDADTPLSPVELDDVTLAVLAGQGYQPASVPAAGVTVLIQRNGNLAIDVTDSIHPENAAILVLAARTIGLDIAGIDLVAQDIAVPIRAQGGAIIEVNAMPSLVMHLFPGTGLPQPVQHLIVDAIFPAGEDGRIPIAAVHAGPDSTAIAHQLSQLLISAGLTVGLAASDGTFIDGQLTRSGNCATSQAAADLLFHPMIQAAVLETPSEAILDEGLAFDRCHVAVISGADSPVLRSVAAHVVASAAEAAAILSA